MTRERLACCPTWSPDHTRIAYWGSRTYSAGFEEVTVVSRDGGRKRRITGQGWGFPAWSPDGRTIAAACADVGACERLAGLYLIDVRRPSQKRRLSGTFGASESSWAPGGKRLVLVDDRRGRGDLFVKRLGRKPRRITSTGVDEAGPDWSPNGRWIVFTKPRTPSQPHDLWMVSPDGQRLRRLTRTDANETQPAWSPSGKRILFSTPRGGLFSIRSDGTHRRTIPGSRRGDCCADW